MYEERERDRERDRENRETLKESFGLFGIVKGKKRVVIRGQKLLTWDKNHIRTY
jgi:hypothetical protein